jgi:large subunit ribosomal protein L18
MPIKPEVKKNRRASRVRTRIARQVVGRARLSVHRSNSHIYAQIIDDLKGHTLAAASTQDKQLKGKVSGNKDGAIAVGKLVAERAIKAGVKDVVFDRGPYLFHGRVKALADAAREAGLSF